MSAQTGEDSLLVTPVMTGERCTRILLGVFDGVGGWAMRNVDSGFMSRMLSLRCSTAFSEGEKSPLKCLTEAHCRIVNNNEVVGGSTTACLISLWIDANDDVKMTTANLGDSAFKIFRGTQTNPTLRFQSRLQRHGESSFFSPPFQLAALGEEYKHLPVCNDDPSAAECEIDKVLLPLDRIVLATDGVWDNIAEEVLVDILSDPLTCSNEKAFKIVDECSRNSWKLDDMTVVVVESLVRLGIL